MNPFLKNYGMSFLGRGCLINRDRKGDGEGVKDVHFKGDVLNG